MLFLSLAEERLYVGEYDLIFNKGIWNKYLLRTVVFTKLIIPCRRIQSYQMVSLGRYKACKLHSWKVHVICHRHFVLNPDLIWFLITNGVVGVGHWLVTPLCLLSDNEPPTCFYATAWQRLFSFLTSHILKAFTYSNTDVFVEKNVFTMQGALQWSLDFVYKMLPCCQNWF